jgi:hypothetical protein
MFQDLIGLVDLSDLFIGGDVLSPVRMMVLRKCNPSFPNLFL